MKATKIVSIIVLLAVLVSTVAGAYLGFAGRNTQMVTVNVNGEETERALYRQVAFIPNTFKKNWQEAIVPSAQLGGGIEYIYTADQGDMTDAEFNKAVKSAAKVLGKRAEMLAGDASASYEGNTISITVPGKEYDSLFASILTPVGDFSLCLYDATTGMFLDPVLTDDHIKDAGYYMDSTGTSYTLQLQLTKKGQKTLAAYAKEHSGEALYLLQDGGYLGYVSMYSTMDTEYLSVPTEDWSYALGAAICLRSGELPLSLGMSNYLPAEGKLSALLDVVVMGMLIVTVLAMLFVILRGKTAGLVNALTIAAQGVVFCLALALTAVSTDWKLTVGALFLLTACQVLFLGGMILVNEKIAAFNQRGLKIAAAKAVKTLKKPLCIIYGALIVLGGAMMILFSAQPAAVLGRIVALSGIISFATIFVVLRVLISCAVSIKRK